MKKISLLVVLYLNVGFVIGQSLDSIAPHKPKDERMPNIDGTIRAKYEYNISKNQQRFMVRNARFQVNGQFNKFFAFKAELDLSDEGTTKMLDAYIEAKPVKKLSVFLGQVKIPFSTDNLRSPAELNFANRSFISKRISKNLRDVGGMVVYKNKESKIPFELFAGAFNGSGLYDQVYVDHPNFGFRAVAEPLKGFKMAGDLYSGNILKTNNGDLLLVDGAAVDSARLKMFDVCLSFEKGGFFAETEYAFKNHDLDSLSYDYGAFFIYVLYHFELKNKAIKRITPAIRYDSYFDNINATTDQPDRITAGLTFGFDKLTYADIRLDYEKYFYNDQDNKHDKFTVELIVRF